LQKNKGRPFLDATPKNVFMIFVGENLQENFVKQLFRQVLGNSGKNTSHPQKCVCSYTYVQDYQNKDRLSACRIILLQRKPKLGHNKTFDWAACGPQVGQSCVRSSTEIEAFPTFF